LAAAVAECVFVAGTSARTGGLVRRQSVGTPEEILPQALDMLRLQRPVALVFGPESRGLTNEEVTRCHFLIHIPADPGYPALNLAQAVGIILYELRRAWCRPHDVAVHAREPPARFAAQELMFERLRQALEAIHFLYGDKAPSLMHAVRHLLGRAQPTEMEIEILLGLARQIQWFVQRHQKNLDSPQ
jgi:tRNA/rRNA methyltransferase